MARFILVDHGAGYTRIRHPQVEVQVLFVLRPQPENRRRQDQHDLRAGQMAAARRGDRLHRGGDAHVRCVAGIIPRYPFPFAQLSDVTVPLTLSGRRDSRGYTTLGWTSCAIVYAAKVFTIQTSGPRRPDRSIYTYRIGLGERWNGNSWHEMTRELAALGARSFRRRIEGGKNRVIENKNKRKKKKKR